MFEIESTKIIHSTSDKNFVIANEADIISRLRDISSKGKSELEEKHEELQFAKLTTKKPIVPKSEGGESSQTVVSNTESEDVSRIEFSAQKEESNISIVHPNDMGALSEQEKKRNEQMAMRERLASKYGKRSNFAGIGNRMSNNIADPRGAMDATTARERSVASRKPVERPVGIGSGGAVQTSGSAPMQSNMRNRTPVPMQTFGNGSTNNAEIEIQIVREGQKENAEKSTEDFMAELKARINKTEEKVQKVEELKEHNVTSDGEINVIKTDNVAEEIYSRQKDEEKEKEIAEILKKRQEDLKKYEPMRKKEEASGGFKPPKKQAGEGRKWLIVLVAVLAISIFCGLRANGYAFDEYGFQTAKVNQLTGEVMEQDISGISCLFSSFTVDSVTMFPPVFNSKVFFTAFGTVFGICAVVVLLVWSSADTKKRNRDGKEHGDSKIATKHDIKVYQQMFMD